MIANNVWNGYTLRKKQRSFEILNVFEIDSLNHFVWNWWIYLTMCNILVLIYYVATQFDDTYVLIWGFIQILEYGPEWCLEISRTFRNQFEASYIKRFIILLYGFCFFFLSITSLPFIVKKYSLIERHFDA